MQRVSAFLPSWDKRNSAAHKNGGLFGWSNRTSTSQPPNGLVAINTVAANSDIPKVQREAFWPATLDLECDKAARILKTFCGAYCPLFTILYFYRSLLRFFSVVLLSPYANSQQEMAISHPSRAMRPHPRRQTALQVQ